MASALAPAPTGLDLRLKRAVAGRTPNKVTHVLGINRQPVGQIEDMCRRPSFGANRHRRALDVGALPRQGRR